MSKRIGRTHLVIPDCQVKPGVPLDHLRWIGRYAEEKRPDVIVNIGDFADVPSLNSHAKPGSADLEGQRYQADIDAAKEAMDILLKPIRKVRKYKPQMVLTLGNHEHRINREIEAQPKFRGKISIDDLGYKEAGWTVYPFLEIATIDGIEYCHYFTSGVLNKPVTKPEAILNTRHSSGVMGHIQKTDIKFHDKSPKFAAFVGTCYLHDEPYLGPQGNHQRRHIMMINEVDGTGYGYPYFVSLEFLKANYN